MVTVEPKLETVAVGIVSLAVLNLVARALSNLYKTYLRPAKNLR